MSDAIFWDRLAEMPAWEAEQECVMRRESLTLENAMLQSEREKLRGVNDGESRRSFTDLGVAILENNAQLSRLGERIKYLRKLQAQIQWKETVRELLGDEVVEQCIVHMEMKWAEVFAQRREWAAL